MSAEQRPQLICIGDSHCAALLSGARQLGLSCDGAAWSGSVWHDGHFTFDENGIAPVGLLKIEKTVNELRERLGRDRLVQLGQPVLTTVGFHLGRLVPPFGWNGHQAFASNEVRLEEAHVTSRAFLRDYVRHHRAKHFRVLKAWAAKDNLIVVTPPRAHQRPSYDAFLEELIVYYRSAGIFVFDTSAVFADHEDGLVPASLLEEDGLHGTSDYGAKIIEAMTREGLLEGSRLAIGSAESAPALRTSTYRSAAPLEEKGEDADESLESKAPNRYRKRMQMLSRMPKGGRCAEVGVWKGAFTNCILEVTQPSEIILIDPWDQIAERPKTERTHPLHADEDFMGSMRDMVAAKFIDRPEVVLRQGFSADVLKEIEDDYLDWIYIDGNHRYDFVKIDLQLAARKVRLGGIIAGDDLFWKRDGRMQVREAVLEFLEGAGLRRKVEHIGQQYLIPVGPELKSAYAD